MSNSVIRFYKPYLPDLDVYSKRLEHVWEKSRVTNNGPLVNQLECLLQEYLGVKNVILISSGTIGLQLSIKALGIEGKVLTTPFSYVASSNTLVWEKCIPVYSDICSNDFSFPISKWLLKKKKAGALLPVHVFGFPFWGAERKTLKEVSIPIVVDAAHAFGVKQNGRSILHSPRNWLNVVSLHATKIFHTIEGGAIITSSSSMAKTLRSMRNSGFNKNGNPVRLGLNAKMSELHAAVGIAILPQVKGLIARNKKIHHLYCEALRLKNHLLKTPLPPKNLELNYSYFPVICSSKITLGNLTSLLNRYKIEYKRYFNFPLNKLSYVSYSACPEAEQIAQRIICLPVYPSMDSNEIEKVCSVIAELK